MAYNNEEICGLMRCGVKRCVNSRVVGLFLHCGMYVMCTCETYIDRNSCRGLRQLVAFLFLHVINRFYNAFNHNYLER